MIVVRIIMPAKQHEIVRHDSVLLGYITREAISSERQANAIINTTWDYNFFMNHHLNSDCNDDDDGGKGDRRHTDFLITVYVTALIQLSNLNDYLSLISGDFDKSSPIDEVGNCLSVLGLLLVSCPLEGIDEEFENIAAALIRRQQQQQQKQDDSKLGCRSRRCRQSIRHTYATCSKLQRVLIETLFANSQYFLCIKKCKEISPRIADLDINYSSSSSETTLLNPKTCRNCPQDLCYRWERSFFMDRMTQCLSDNYITFIYYNPNELLTSHLLRGIISHMRNLQQPNISTNNIKLCQDDCKINWRYCSHFPPFIPYLFNSLESTYCALETSLKTHKLSLRVSSFSNGGDTIVLSLRENQKLGCHSGLPSRYKGSGHRIVKALFNLKLVAFSNSHRRSLISEYNNHRNLENDFHFRGGLHVEPLNDEQIYQNRKSAYEKLFGMMGRPMKLSIDRHNLREDANQSSEKCRRMFRSKERSGQQSWLEQIQTICVKKTCAGSHILIRWLQLKQCYKTISESLQELFSKEKLAGEDDLPGMHIGSFTSVESSPEYQISSRNVLVTVAVDVLAGLIVTLLLMLYIGPNNWFEMSMNHAVRVVDQVQKLLIYLMGMPVGLKLNLPLNQAMGKLFLYHIYLWKTFVTLIRPLLALAIYALMLTGLIGLSCLLSVVCDLLALVTVHIYCFYGYAARFYNLQIRGLIALWRLFRGKKWNLLRHRVDSNSYGTDQLFVGTLSFTILFFLLPTVLTYYLVFFTLHTITKGLQETLKYIYYLLIVFPYYTILLWMCNSKRVACQVRMLPMNEFRHDKHKNAGSVLIDWDTIDRRLARESIYLTSCVTSLKTTLIMDSQLHSYQNSKQYRQRGYQDFRNKLFIFRLSQSHPTTELLSLKCICNKLLLGEIF